MFCATHQPQVVSVDIHRSSMQWIESHSMGGATIPYFLDSASGSKTANLRCNRNAEASKRFRKHDKEKKDEVEKLKKENEDLKLELKDTRQKLEQLNNIIAV